MAVVQRLFLHLPILFLPLAIDSFCFILDYFCSMFNMSCWMIQGSTGVAIKLSWAESFSGTWVLHIRCCGMSRLKRFNTRIIMYHPVCIKTQQKEALQSTSVWPILTYFRLVPVLPFHPIVLVPPTTQNAWSWMDNFISQSVKKFFNPLYYIDLAHISQHPKCERTPIIQSPKQRSISYYSKVPDAFFCHQKLLNRNRTPNNGFFVLTTF